MRARFIFGVFLVFLLFTLTGGCGSRVQSPEKLLDERCTTCHTLAPIEAKRKKRSEWEKTVYRMVNKGARLSDREAETVIEYLARNYGPEQP